MTCIMFMLKVSSAHVLYSKASKPCGTGVHIIVSIVAHYVNCRCCLNLMYLRDY